MLVERLAGEAGAFITEDAAEVSCSGSSASFPPTASSTSAEATSITSRRQEEEEEEEEEEVDDDVEEEEEEEEDEEEEGVGMFLSSSKEFFLSPSKALVAFIGLAIGVESAVALALRLTLALMLAPMLVKLAPVSDAAGPSGDTLGAAEASSMSHIASSNLLPKKFVKSVAQKT